MQELGLKIECSGVEQAIEALNRLEAAAIAAQKAVSAVGFTYGDDLKTVTLLMRKWDSEGLPPIAK